jgi:hypothetical protein
MKRYIILFAIALCTNFVSKAQEVNWRLFNESYRHLISANLGADYGTNYGFAYGYKLSGPLPIVLGTELSIPFGNQLLDDWKVKLNGQSELWHNEKLSLGIKPGIIVRRYQSDAARLYNIGAEITTTFGYYRPKWGGAIEVNYDKALFTHIKHDMLKDYYPAIRDGWYGSTGGNFKFGIKANYSFKTWNIVLKTGKMYAQDFKDNSTLPFFFDIWFVKYL